MRKIIVLSLLFFSIAAIGVGYIYRQPIKRWLRVKNILNRQGGFTKECPGCVEYFPDVVAVMNRAYKKEKIQPQQKLSDLDNLLSRGILVKIPNNDRYTLDQMDHSRPYVLSVVNTFLEDLAAEYQKNLKMENLTYLPFIITSGTRSVESAKELTEENDIARTQSHHLLGKTIDISYKRFGDRRAEQRCFIEALRTLREQDRCYVKYEQSGALHLTVR